MLEHEARAMAVKMLDEGELCAVHAAEEKMGFHFLAYEVARYSRKARMSSAGIRKWWGIPDNQQSQTTHAERVRGDLVFLMRAQQCHPNLSDKDSRANFDWHVLNSSIDFSYNGSRAGVEENPFEARSDRRSSAYSS